MGIAVIPDDWTEGYIELCVLWPNSPDWLAVLRGQLVAPYDETFWDRHTGTPSDPQAAIIETFDQNLHLEECMQIPVGSIFPYASLSPPNGWLICNGDVVSRTTYEALFNEIGVLYGAGDGTTTFNVPNCKGRVLVGRDTGQPPFDTVGETGGANAHTLTIGEMPAHTHTQIGSLTAGAVTPGGSVMDQLSTATGSTGGGSPHNNLQPYIVIGNFIIKT